MMAMSELKIDGIPVRSNQFLYKAILINTIILMQAAPSEPSAQVRVENQLKNVFSQQIAYCENDSNHPFLEEVVSLYATYFEQTGSYQNALIMHSKFLRIQQSLLGEDTDAMIPTYKKMAALAVAVGQPTASQKYLLSAQELTVKFQVRSEDQTDEQKKQELEDKVALLY